MGKKISYYYFYSTVFNVVGLHQILAFICLIMVFTSGVMIYQNYGTRAVHKFNVLFSIMMLTFQSFSLFYFLRITDAFNNENIGGCNGKYWCHTFNGTKEGKTWGPGIGFWISVNSFSGSILNLILSIIQYYSTRNMDRPSPPSHLEYPTIEFINSIDSIKNYHNNLIYNDMTNQSNGNNYTYKSSSIIV
ncbi:hypothetical protein PPL_06378 [Heterostelium album PN500]|uniref:Uncharacterized protein n=1 Tax=Heterostelium pallidum (strain ATCC 26659 / Pp 5 / PN500) TaxID=670386 RepID=D3BD00_HETP5|nr:hypothetical protein PPL_06378 [Heterostelium album PN500]EFA80792.1 hypothetical protein PPL_06378 [Heterostelium album PN500]|eukprot:XP_020432911.1 hypothetical protein PPL_06378 [Heterostelium album PN500]